MSEIEKKVIKNMYKEVVIDFLYLDLTTCDRCQGTEEKLDEALTIFKSIAECLNYSVIVNKINVDTEILAKMHHFESSPTIRVNGKDILGEINENACAACSEISGEETACRVFEYAGSSYNEPPTAMILEGILKAVFRQKAVSVKKQYELPQNLKGFYATTEKKSGGCSCGSNGCC